MPSGRKDITANFAGGTSLNLKKNQSISAANLGKLQSVESLETHLLANGYTQAQLNKMTKNDMLFAARKSLSLA